MATIASLDVVLDVKNRGTFKRDMTAVVAAVVAAGVAFDQLMERGGKIQPVMRAFGQRVGDQEVALSKLRTATMGLVSDYNLMQQANTALTLGSATTVDEFATLASTAQRLGRALGVDAQMALNSLNTGIARQSRLLLDNIGLIVDTEAAYKRYAAQLGVNVSQLTEAQRKEAFRIETMEQARQKLSELGEETFTAADAWAGLKVEIGNTADALATFVAGSSGTAGVINGVTRDVRILTFELKDFLETRDAVLQASDRRAFGTGLPSVETGAAGKGGASAAARREEQLEQARALGLVADETRRAFEETMRFEEMLDVLTNSVAEVRVGEINPLTGKLLDFGDVSQLLSHQWIPELDTSMQDASVAAEILRQYMEALNEEMSETERLSRAAALGLRGITGLGQLFGFDIPGLSNIFGGLSFFKSISGISDLFGGGRAHGGPVSGGTAYMVGERGPEMFVPQQSGAVIPNGGITINVPPARDPMTYARDQQWTRAVEAAFRTLEGNGFRAAPA